FISNRYSNGKFRYQSRCYSLVGYLAKAQFCIGLGYLISNQFGPIYHIWIFLIGLVVITFFFASDILVEIRIS
ncbi:Os01g0586801, partial [Oryza sativa Japonica Group]